MNCYLIIALRNSTFDPTIIGPHNAYLDKLKQAGSLQLAGGFNDALGGAYTILAEDYESAKTLALQDPLAISGNSTLTVYEWKI